MVQIQKKKQLSSTLVEHYNITETQFELKIDHSVHPIIQL